VSEETQGAVEAAPLTSLSSLFAARDRGEEIPRPAVAAPEPEPAAAEPEAVEAVETAAAEPPPAEKPERERGPDGKFAKGDPNVALRQARERAKALEAELAALKAPKPEVVAAPAETPKPARQPVTLPPMPDLLIDGPEKVQAWLDQRDLLREHVRYEEEAREKHGNDKVEAALARMESAMQAGQTWEYQRVMKARNPYAELMKWDAEQAVRAEIGTDPDAYRERLKAEILAEIGELQPQAQQPVARALPVNMPGNFANMKSASAPSGKAWAGPTPLKDIVGRF
jgi:hypothetical protein